MNWIAWGETYAYRVALNGRAHMNVVTKDGKTWHCSVVVFYYPWRYDAAALEYAVSGGPYATMEAAQEAALILLENTGPPLVPLPEP